LFFNLYSLSLEQIIDYENISSHISADDTHSYLQPDDGGPLEDLCSRPGRLKLFLRLNKDETEITEFMKYLKETQDLKFTKKLNDDVKNIGISIDKKII